MFEEEATDDIHEATLAELRAALDAGRLSALELTRAYLARSEALNPGLRAILAVNPEAEAIARARDAERRRGEARGALHGIPILIKDNIDTGDALPTTAGSLALARSFASRDAFIVRRLREAGAVLLGKTNLSEWANFRSLRSSSGWSSLGGQTSNPYAPERSPGGSSSGSGVAVACSMCAAAIGTETDGSIMSPASLNGVVGIKPTVGLVSRTGIIPIAHSQDTAGPMARTVEDAAAVLQVIAGRDEEDPATHRPLPERGAARSLRGRRVGIARGIGPRHPGVSGLLEAAVEALESEGAQMVDDVELIASGELSHAELEVLLYEFKAGIDGYLGRRASADEVRSLAELIAFNASHAARVMPHFGQELLLAAQAKGGLEESAYRGALQTARRLARTEGLDAALARGELDALVAITAGPAWAIDLVHGDHHAESSSTFAAVAGYPSVTVPAGHVGGLPVGLSFIGAACSDFSLIGYARTFERATRMRRPPAARYSPSGGEQGRG